jgi:endoglucanase
MSRPAVPYHEHAVRAQVERLCAEHGLKAKRDRFGNVLVRLQTPSRRRPLVLAAHMDHPGFEIVRPLSATKWLARFRGGVADRYFRRGTPVRLLPSGTKAILGRRRGADRTFEVSAKIPPRTSPQFAVWELEDFAVRGHLIHGRACDDLIGVASVLAALIELNRSRARVNVIGVISRAEEVGFNGALAVAASGGIPKDSLIISLETSRELPGVKMGGGVILRVGDRTSIFDPEATRFLAEVAANLRRTRRGFTFQRGLMSGGTCEATAYQEFGFQTAAVCVALGNYHNCAERRKIAAEYVSIPDALGMIELLAAAARAMPRYKALVARLPRRLRNLCRRAQRELSRR